jgi:hypothetical protein
VVNLYEDGGVSFILKTGIIVLMTMLFLVTVCLYGYVWMCMSLDSFYISGPLVVPSVDHLNKNKTNKQDAGILYVSISLQIWEVGCV